MSEIHFVYFSAQLSLTLSSKIWFKHYFHWKTLCIPVRKDDKVQNYRHLRGQYLLGCLYIFLSAVAYSVVREAGFGHDMFIRATEKVLPGLLCYCLYRARCSGALLRYVRAQSPVVSDSLQSHGLEPTRLLCPWGFPGKNTGVGCHFLPSPGHHPNPEIEPKFLAFPELAGGFFTTEPLGKHEVLEFWSVVVHCVCDQLSQREEALIEWSVSF